MGDTTVNATTKIMLFISLNFHHHYYYHQLHHHQRVAWSLETWLNIGMLPGCAAHFEFGHTKFDFDWQPVKTHTLTHTHTHMTLMNVELWQVHWLLAADGLWFWPDNGPWLLLKRHTDNCSLEFIKCFLLLRQSRCTHNYCQAFKFSMSSLLCPQTTRKWTRFTLSDCQSYFSQTLSFLSVWLSTFTCTCLIF